MEGSSGAVAFGEELPLVVVGATCPDGGLVSALLLRLLVAAPALVSEELAAGLVADDAFAWAESGRSVALPEPQAMAVNISRLMVPVASATLA